MFLHSVHTPKTYFYFKFVGNNVFKQIFTIRKYVNDSRIDVKTINWNTQIKHK